MSEAAEKKKGGGWLKAALIGVLGLGGGAAGTYATAVVNQVVKPPLPVANFSVSADGLNVTCQNHATGQSGWWDFGDGSPLEPFAAEKPASHTYAKAGNYTVKLTVRNYFADENERSVPVEVGAAAAKESPAPQITGFAVTPIGNRSTAPATFRVTADVTNADGCVWDFGDNRIETGEAGKIDRMVTFDRAGPFTVQLFAHGGKAAAKQAVAVRVESAPAGTLTAVLKVTDSGTRVTHATRMESVAIPVPTQKGAAANFSKVVQARPGSTITEAAANPNVPGVKNLKVAVAADKHSVTVSGEWAGDQKATTKAAGGSDVIVPLKLTEERATAVQPMVTMVTAAVDYTTTLPLPPAVPGLTREYQIELRQVDASGRTVVLARGPKDGKGSVTFPWRDGRTGTTAGWGVEANLAGDKVVMKYATNLGAQ